MRAVLMILCVSIGLASCGSKETLNDPNAIVFKTKPVQNESMLVKLTLIGHTDKTRMELRMDIKSQIPEEIDIFMVAVQNANGGSSPAEGLSEKSAKVRGNADTTVVLSLLKPSYDIKLFNTTGLLGLMDSLYHIQVFYSIKGKSDPRIMALDSRIPKEIYDVYRAKHEVPVQVYFLDTAKGFEEKQQDFLKANLHAAVPPFVHLTEQELAVAGLNFRITSFYRNDSLYTQMFVVNHSEMSIKVDTSKMKMIVDGEKPGDKDTYISSTRIIGSKDEPDMLHKGNRMSFRMRKYVSERPEKFWYAFEEAFFLSEGKALFSGNLPAVHAYETLASDEKNPLSR